MRFGLMRFIFQIGCIAAVLFSSSTNAVDVREGVIGIVTENSFLLSSAPNVKRGDGAKYGLVGYLPIGTRIKVVGPKKQVANLQEGHQETYFPIESSLGIHGLLRQDLFRVVRDGRLGVVVSSYKIPLHQRAEGEEKPSQRLRTGSLEGTYLEFENESIGAYWPATLHRTLGPTGYPSEEPVSVWRTLIEEGEIVLVPPLGKQAEEVILPRWSDKKPIANEEIETLVEEAQKKIAKNRKEILGIMSDVSAIQCLLSATSELNVGFSIFGNGLGFQLAADIKNREQMYRLMKRTLEYEGKSETYTFLQNVKCKGAQPVRLQQLTIQRGIYSPNERVRIHLEDFQKKGGEWSISLSGSSKPFRMIRVGGVKDYRDALRDLNNLVTGSDSFIAQMSPSKRQVMMNAILREIAHFEHRETIVNQEKTN